MRLAKRDCVHCCDAFVFVSGQGNAPSAFECEDEGFFPHPHGKHSTFKKLADHLHCNALHTYDSRFPRTNLKIKTVRLQKVLLVLGQFASQSGHSCTCIHVSVWSVFQHEERGVRLSGQCRVQTKEVDWHSQERSESSAHDSEAKSHDKHHN